MTDVHCRHRGGCGRSLLSAHPLAEGAGLSAFAPIMASTASAGVTRTSNAIAAGSGRRMSGRRRPGLSKRVSRSGPARGWVVMTVPGMAERNG